MIKKEELRKIAKTGKKEIREVPIHHDKKRQIYTIRLPVTFAELANVTNKNRFKFILISKYSENKQNWKTCLRGELI